MIATVAIKTLATNGVNADNVRMTHPRHGLRFTIESSRKLSLLIPVCADHFESSEAAKVSLMHLIDHAHSALP